MHSYKGTIITSIEYSQLSILSMVLHIFLTLKVAVIQFCQSIFQNTSHRSKAAVKDASKQASKNNPLELRSTRGSKDITMRLC